MPPRLLIQVHPPNGRYSNQFALRKNTVIKKITIEQLKPGIYIHDLDVSWLKHPFIRNRLLIKDEVMVEKIREMGIQEMYIDTTKGLDVYEAPSKEELVKIFKSKFDEFAQVRPKIEVKISRREELPKARQLNLKAKHLVKKFSESLSRGQVVSINEITDLSGNVIDSVSRNKDAMLSLMAIRRMDEYTFTHSVNVMIMMIAMGKQLELDEKQLMNMATGALLHDIGKLRLPQELINKKGTLTAEEMEQVRRHVEYGQEMIQSMANISIETTQVVTEHHERFDGSGYPKGLQGDEISLGGQMSSIIDVYDAITTERIYADGLDMVTGLRKIYEWSHFLFKDDLVESFIKTMGIYPVGTLVQLNNGLIGVVIESGRQNALRPTVRIIYDSRRKIHLPPRDINLSDQANLLQIISSESPEKWGLNPGVFIL